MSLTLPVEELTRSCISISFSGPGGFPFFKMTPLPDASPINVPSNLSISFHISHDVEGCSVSASISSLFSSQASSSASSQTSSQTSSPSLSSHDQLPCVMHDDLLFPSSLESDDPSIPTDVLTAKNSETFHPQDCYFSDMAAYPTHDTAALFSSGLTFDSTGPLGSYPQMNVCDENNNNSSSTDDHGNGFDFLDQHHGISQPESTSSTPNFNRCFQSSSHSGQLHPECVNSGSNIMPGFHGSPLGKAEAQSNIAPHQSPGTHSVMFFDDCTTPLPSSSSSISSAPSPDVFSLSDPGSSETSPSTDGSRQARQKRFPCLDLTCKRLFTSEYTRRVHMVAHNNKPRKALPCTMREETGCKEFFSRAHDRLRHEVAMHGKECEWVCQKCGRFFSSDRMLRIHKCPGGVSGWLKSRYPGAAKQENKHVLAP